jgi:hypothetical protein
VWQGGGDGTLVIDAALGSATEPRLPLLRTRLEARVDDEAGAEALGTRAAEQLTQAGGAAYLVAP